MSHEFEIGAGIDNKEESIGDTSAYQETESTPRQPETVERGRARVFTQASTEEEQEPQEADALGDYEDHRLRTWRRSDVFE